MATQAAREALIAAGRDELGHDQMVCRLASSRAQTASAAPQLRARGFCAGWTKGAHVRVTCASRIPFVLAVAILAAGLGDAFVETVSNTGIFGAGYADDDHHGVVPTLLAGALIALEMLVLRLREVWRHSKIGARDALIDLAKDIGQGSAARDFPVIFALQLVALFALESAEALATGHQICAGARWLGGPILVSLTAHALIACACRIVLGACMRAIVRTFTSLVETIARCIWLGVTRPSGAAFRMDRLAPAAARVQAPHVREIGGRAPPRFQTLVLKLV